MRFKEYVELNIDPITLLRKDPSSRAVICTPRNIYIGKPGEKHSELENIHGANILSDIGLNSYQNFFVDIDSRALLGRIGSFDGNNIFAVYPTDGSRPLFKQCVHKLLANKYIDLNTYVCGIISPTKIKDLVKNYVKV